MLFTNGKYGRLLILSVPVAVSMLLASCNDEQEALVEQALQQPTPTGDTPLVVLNSDASLSLSGRFDVVDGYLSRSPQVLSGQGNVTATFRINVPQAGFYELHLWWPQAAADAGTAEVVVRDADGQTTTNVDQRILGGQWNSIGMYAWAAGGQAEIVLRGNGASKLLVDAVRLQYQGAARPGMQWRIAELPLALRDTSYAAELLVVGGTPPYRFSLSDGVLPQGLSMNDRGVITGTPTTAGSSAFTVEVRDAKGTKLYRKITIETSASQGSEPGNNGLPVLHDNHEQAKAVSSAPNLSALLNTVANLPEGGWSRVNLNAFSSVWAPPELRPLYRTSNPPPSKIISAWSSFTWDSRRGDLVLWGGGHANYRGNDVYIWRGSTQQWERGSLPSEMVQDDLGYFNAIDGAAHAPASTHTYDNSMYFPGIDRVVILGGAADPNGDYFFTVDKTTGKARKTGIYLFDPSRADGNKVGGTTGSHVRRVAPYPEILGGHMWSNRESYLNAQPGAAPPNEPFVNGCTGVTSENGKDVGYVRTQYRLYRYTLNDLNDPKADRWDLVGRFYNVGSGTKSTCGYDPKRKLFVSTHKNDTPFLFWNLSSPGTIVNDTSFRPTNPGNDFYQQLADPNFFLHNCGLEHDPKRDRFMLWCGDGRVWSLTPPATASATGWTLEKQPMPTTPLPTENIGTGVMGKWKYIPNLDVFMGLLDPVQGNVWIYKPAGWQNPTGSSLPPMVSLSQPSANASFLPGAAIALSANANDDGSVAVVEFFANGVKIGQSTAAPWSMNWINAPEGSHALTAVATDNTGATTTSPPTTINVTGSTVRTVVLQRGQSGASSVADTYLSSYAPHHNMSFGGAVNVIDQGSQYTSLLRFAIFQSEGGPVPDGATIQSASLSLYKYSYYDMVYSLHRMLQDWSETQATWLQRSAGLPWASAGANAMGTDYRATADASATTGYDAGRLQFDVTAAVAQMSAASPRSNFGWRLRGVSGNANLKKFYSSDWAGDPTLRPRLTITYK